VEVSTIIINQGMVHTSLVLKEVDWFFNRMGIDDSYFATNSAQDIAKHISSIYAGKIIAKNTATRHDFNLQQEDPDTGRAFFICRSQMNSLMSTATALEQRLDGEYLLEGYSGTVSKVVPHPYRLKVFRSTGSIVDDADIQLRFYLLFAPIFSITGDAAKKETDITKVGDAEFLKRASQNTKTIYQELMNEVCKTGNPTSHISTRNCDFADERRLVIAYRHGTMHSLFSTITDLYHFYKLYTTKK
jgi:glutamate dehydrogenase